MEQLCTSVAQPKQSGVRGRSMAVTKAIAHWISKQDKARWPQAAGSLFASLLLSLLVSLFVSLLAFAFALVVALSPAHSLFWVFFALEAFVECFFALLSVIYQPLPLK